jgi:hypothetical protein
MLPFSSNKKKKQSPPKRKTSTTRLSKWTRSGWALNWGLFVRSKADLFQVQWYPQITELVEEINTNFVQHFQRIGSVGAVQLDEEGPYDQWGIKIMVKFRANENLNQLTKERQSGGVSLSFG